ncbi:MAG: hypothetical protein AMXMBFR23_20960 [Chloroflexota bacterium]
MLLALAATGCASDEETTEATVEAVATAAATEEAPTATPEPAPTPDAGNMLGALVQIDGAGFAAIDSNLNGEKPEIAAAWLGKVEKASLAAQSVLWPDATKGAVDAFVKAANDLAGALKADDAAKAAPLAKAAAEAQAALSAETYKAVSAAGAKSVTGAGPTLGALGVINLAGIATMEKTLVDGGEVNAAWEGRVANARIAASALEWPGESQAAADTFIKDATAFEAAIKAGDAAKATEAATALNKSRGTLATRGYGALSGMRETADGNGAKLAALAAVDNAAFHDIDETLNGDKAEVNAAWAGRIGTAKRAVQTIKWGEGVQDLATTLSRAISALETELAVKDKDGKPAVDIAKAAAAAKAAHEAQHAFSEKAYAGLGSGVSAH